MSETITDETDTLSPGSAVNESGFTEPPVEALSLVEVLHALGHEERLAIVAALARCPQGKMGCREAAAGQDVPKATLSRHFETLRGAGLISTHRDGAKLENRLRRQDLDARFPGLLDAVLGAAHA